MGRSGPLAEQPNLQDYLYSESNLGKLAKRAEKQAAAAKKGFGGGAKKSAASQVGEAARAARSSFPQALQSMLQKAWHAMHCMRSLHALAERCRARALVHVDSGMQPRHPSFLPHTLKIIHIVHHTMFMVSSFHSTHSICCKSMQSNLFNPVPPYQFRSN
jgi:hypothetical protein